MDDGWPSPTIISRLRVLTVPSGFGPRSEPLNSDEIKIIRNHYYRGSGCIYPTPLSYWFLAGGNNNRGTKRAKGKIRKTQKERNN